jgi:uncharacterized protein (DUF362 family)
MSIVAIAHTKEKHRSEKRVYQLVRDALEHLGGMEHFVRSGNTVLLKPNQTVFYSAEEGCTTDPLVVGALIQLAREAGAARVQVAESSGGFFSSSDCMRVTGMARIAKKFDAELIDLGSDDVPNNVVAIPNGEVIREVPLPRPVLDADVIVDVPKAKNHHIEPISGALKNWVGLVNQRWRNHNHGDVDMIKRFMDIMSVARPHLTVADAIICGEGDGPIANLPRWCGCVLASDDPVAIDVTIARLLGHDPDKLQFAREAEKRGIGVRDPIEYRGVPLQQVAFPAWKGHEGFDYLPINFLVGEGVTLEGTIGHVKSVLDSMMRRGQLNEVIALKGTPTVMIGTIEDPTFEAHLQEGPYLVFDDAALPKYKEDKRVHFVGGHPVLRDAMPELMKGLGVSMEEKLVQKWEQFQDQVKHAMEFDGGLKGALPILKPIAIAGAGIGIFYAIKKLANKKGR